MACARPPLLTDRHLLAGASPTQRVRFNSTNTVVIPMHFGPAAPRPTLACAQSSLGPVRCASTSPVGGSSPGGVPRVDFAWLCLGVSQITREGARSHPPVRFQPDTVALVGLVHRFVLVPHPGVHSPDSAPHSIRSLRTHVPIPLGFQSSTPRCLPSAPVP